LAKMRRDLSQGGLEALSPVLTLHRPVVFRQPLPPTFDPSSSYALRAVSAIVCGQSLLCLGGVELGEATVIEVE